MIGPLGQFIPDRIKVQAMKSSLYNRYAAKKLAHRARRLDLCAAQFAHIFHRMPGMSLENSRCLEIGSGWVLTHPLVCYLLGARCVTATDILPLARPEYLRNAIDVSDASLVREVLSPFSTYDQIRERLSRLQREKRFSFESLQKIGISYLAPLDLEKNSLPHNYDFIYSFDVLEHVPKTSLVAILTKLSNSLNSGGCMVHSVHTEDHRDSKNDPFAFLSEPEGSYSASNQMMRGNRLRRDEWRSILDQVPGIMFTFLYEWYRSEKPIPEWIDPSVRSTNDRDLRIAYLGVIGKKS